MRIGIITFHYVSNYGAVLQCAALQETLRELGHEPWVINYVPRPAKRRSIIRGWRLNGSFRKGFVGRLIQITRGAELERVFQTFRDRFLNMTPECSSSADISRICDQLGIKSAVAGSDQVWHFSRTGEYFLHWKSPLSFRRISYAPSCATDDQDYTRSEEIRTWLSSYSALSVRDAPSARAIGKVTGTMPVIVADPTLLCDPSIWVPPKTGATQEPYLLVYILGEADAKILKLTVEKAKARLGIKKVITIVASSRNPRHAAEADQVVWNGDPGTWLSLIRDCAAFVTDSFHGTIFAMKYHRPFLTFFVEQIRAPRLHDIAERYNIHDRVCALDELPECIGLLENEVSRESLQRIDRHVAESLDYLRCSLES